MCARRAAAVVTVSNSARDDILRVLRLDPDKVHVIPEAPAATFRIIEGQALEQVRARYSLGRPFVLHVGTIEPRKNLHTLVAAFERLHREGRREQLVLAGPLGWRYAPLMRQIRDANLGDAIRHLGYVDEANLPALYNLASVVAFPSLYEGCGLPILEAMACGVPVLTSNHGAMAETAAEAAVLVTPTDITAVADGLARMLDVSDVRRELRARGLRRASEFSWERAADEHVQLYERVSNRM
jgi:glycosyltransferase involved in cell wall biosynthesis